MKLSNDPYATYKLLSTELKGRGYNVSPVIQDRRLFITFTAPNGQVWHTAAAHIHYPFTSSTARQLSRDKASAYAYAQTKQVPVPFTRRIEHEEYLNDDELTDIVQNYAPLIVKPNDSSLSKGLTMYIETADNVKNAVRVARLVKESDVLIQQQVVGEEIRFVVIKGKVVAALLRQTPRVIGDGIHTVEALIQEENRVRERLVFPYISYPPLTAALIGEAYLHDQRILEKGEVLEFSRATMIRNGCSVYQILGQVHPSYIEEIEKMVEEIDTSFLVADFLINDYRSERQDDNHWFLEFNCSPVLKLFYGCRDGDMIDVLPVIADLIDETLNQP